MRRFMPLIVILVIGAGAYFYFFMLEDFQWPKAKTSLEAIDNFNKAVKDRDYKHAAKYCTKTYAELMVKVQEEAKKLGKSIDNLQSRMTQDGVSTKEMEYIIALLDPMPPIFQLEKATEGEKEGTANVSLPLPAAPTDTRENWKLDLNMIGPLYTGWFARGNNKAIVKLVNEGGAWLIDFPVDQAMNNRVTQLKARYRDYVNAIDKLSQEIKVDRTVKEDVRRRMKELLEQAAKNEQ